MTEPIEALVARARNMGLELALPTEDGDWLKQTLQSIVQALIEADASGVIGAGRYERSEERTNYRNGHRAIEPYRTRVGELALTVPKLRKGSYFPSFLTARRPVEKALVATIQAAYVEGVSTRRVDQLVQALGLTGIDKSEVSRLCKELDDAVRPFRERRLEYACPYVFLDAVYVKGRHDGRVMSRALVIAIGVRETGEREILGFELGPSEDEAFWLQFLRGLLARGLTGVQLVVSDAHQGLKAAVAKALPGTTWQRCRVHFMRNLLGRIPHANKAMVAALIRTVFAQPDRPAASAQLREVAQMMHKRWPEAAKLLTNAEEEILAYMAFPKPHWQRIYSTNILERVNREIRRRTDVVQVFPSDASIYRLVGTILMELSDEWLVEERHYFSRHSMQLLTAPDMVTSDPAPKLAPVR